MADSPTLELYRLKLGALLAEAHRRHIDDDSECAATVRLLERHLAIIDAMTSAERQCLAWLEEQTAQSHLASRCGAAREDVASFLAWWQATHRELDGYFTKFAAKRPTVRDMSQASLDRMKPKSS
jgi:signal recognition particle GTPase